MIKKAIASLLISSVALLALPNDEVALQLMSQAAQKKAIVLSNMSLKEKDKEAFGKLYDEFQKKLMMHRLKSLKIIEYYAKNYEKLDDKKAKELLNDWAKYKKSELEIKESYIKKFEEIMPSALVIRFYQIENRLDTLRDAEIYSAIPLAIPPQSYDNK